MLRKGGGDQSTRSPAQQLICAFAHSKPTRSSSVLLPSPPLPRTSPPRRASVASADRDGPLLTTPRFTASPPDAAMHNFWLRDSGHAIAAQAAGFQGRRQEAGVHAARHTFPCALAKAAAWPPSPTVVVEAGPHSRSN